MKRYVNTGCYGCQYNYYSSWCLKDGVCKNVINVMIDKAFELLKEYVK